MKNKDKIREIAIILQSVIIGLHDNAIGCGTCPLQCSDACCGQFSQGQVTAETILDEIIKECE